MSPLLMSVIVFACVLGGAFLGMFLRNRLPQRHLSEATKDVVKLGTGLIGTEGCPNPFVGANTD